MKRKPNATAKPSKKSEISASGVDGYNDVLNGVVELLESARRTSARATNAIMTATYWEVGRRIVECEQGGANRAEYGVQLTKQLSKDLASRFGRGFGHVNLSQMRRFYLTWPSDEIFQAVSEKSRSGDIAQTPSAQSLIFQTPSEISDLRRIAAKFPLPWSHYVRLLKVEKPEARKFYETEALRGGWSVRQLDRQVSTLFYERTLASRNKARMLENQVLAAEYRLALPDESTLAAELERVQIALASRGFDTGNSAKAKKSPARKKASKQQGGKQ